MVKLCYLVPQSFTESIAHNLIEECAVCVNGIMTITRVCKRCKKHYQFDSFDDDHKYERMMIIRKLDGCKGVYDLCAECDYRSQ